MLKLNKEVKIQKKDGSSFSIGNHLKLSVIAGPCALESREHALKMAGDLKTIAEDLKIGLIYKTSFDKANRTSASSKRGIGLKASIPIFQEIREKLQIPVLTDVHNEQHCHELKNVVDILQIPAFLCRQTDLLKAAAETGCILNIKKGQFLAPWDMENVLSKVADFGNPNMFSCERGVSFGYNTLISDMRSLSILSKMGAPVIFDATHSVQQPGGLGGRSGGQRKFVETLARAACAVGVAGVFIETHDNPDLAPSDGPNMVPLDKFSSLIKTLLLYDEIAKKTPYAGIT